MIVEAIRLLIILAFTVLGLQLAPEIMDVTADDGSGRKRPIDRRQSSVRWSRVRGGRHHRAPWIRSGIAFRSDQGGQQNSPAPSCSCWWIRPSRRSGRRLAASWRFPILLLISQTSVVSRSPGLLIFVVIAATSGRLFAARSDDLMARHRPS